MEKEQKQTLFKIIISSVLLVAVNILDNFQFFEGIKIIPLKFILFLIIYLIIGFEILKEAFEGIFKGDFLDENFLMALATVGAFVLALYNADWNLFLIEDCNEAIFVLLFFEIGELFEDVAVGKSRKNISSLMDIRPDYANIEKDGKLIQVNPEIVEIGTEIVIQPGEKVPIDGIVTEGFSTLNVAALTGESIPLEVEKDSEILSGSINLSGVIKIKTTKKFAESTVSKILNLVENSSSKKSQSEKFISKFSKIYTPAVVISSVCLAVIPPVIQILLKNSANWGEWIYRSLTFLVISCPCALVIGIPLSFFAGLGGASKNGILIKGSNYLEKLSKTKIVVFDKTGTLTKGVFEVQGIHHNKLEDKKILEYAALAECASSHPISKSLQLAYENEIDRNRVSEIEEFSGHGIKAKIDDKIVLIGNEKLMKKFNIEYKSCHSVGTILHISINGEYSGHIVISDVEKPESKNAILNLKKLGISKTVMLTGDSKKIAEKVAADLNVDLVYSELLPQDKVRKVEELLNSKKKSDNLIFVGDGINDAPVLTRADIGISMGLIGSDVAIEASDVVLMDDNPEKIATAIKISKKCLRIVYQNIVFAIGIKFACLILGGLGIANMWFAIFADVGVMVLAVLNAIRALKV